MLKKTSQKRFGFNLNFWLILVLANIIFGSLIIGIGFSWKTNGVLREKIAEIKESERPADLDIIILTESSCEDCFDVALIIDSIKKENVKINSEKTVEITSDEGKELISKFNIDKAPTLIVSGELEKNPTLKASWPTIGEVKDDSFILRQVGAPYILTATNEVKGRIEWVMLTDTSCSECYDVTRHEAILKQFGMPIQNQQVTSSSLDDGKELIVKYKIKLLPTIILTGDIESYPSLTKVWAQVGTIEEDGAYVFRDGVKTMGVYKDLTTNTIVKPTANQSGS